MRINGSRGRGGCLTKLILLPTFIRRSSRIAGEEDWLALTHRAFKCSRRGEYQRSIELAEKAIKLNPRASEAWRLIGNAYELLGYEVEENRNYDLAREYHKKATEAWDKAKKINPHIVIPFYHQ